jgi:pectate lyase
MKCSLSETAVLFVLSCVTLTAGMGAPDFSLVGFAEGVTGGTGGRIVQVGNASEFTHNCQSSEKLIIEVTGTISNASTSIASNKTILGVNTNGELTATTLSINGGSNIIIRNITIHHAAREKDIISISAGRNIWIDHCDIFNSIGDLNGDGKVDEKGDIAGGDVDWYDGLIDMTGSCSNMTISWNNIHDSFKAMLVGSSDSDISDRKITFHHNHFYKLWERAPSYRGGTGHIFNNYYEDIDHSAVNSRINARLLIEGNIFENTGSGEVDARTGIEWGPVGGFYSSTTGCWDVKDNIFINCKGSQPTVSTCTFTPPYNYTETLHSSDEVKTIVTTWAGVGKLEATGVPPADQRTGYSKLSTNGNSVPTTYTCRGERISDKAHSRVSGIIIFRNHTGVHVQVNTLR